MALRILYPGDRGALSTLAADAFTKSNFGVIGPATGVTPPVPGRDGVSGGSDRIQADTPDGALGGMVAAMSDNYEVTICDADLAVEQQNPIGIFLNDAAGSPFENTPAVASGKVTVMHAQGSYETDVYETAVVPYVVGDDLYCSANGLLTNADTFNAVIIGVVTKAPSLVDPFLGFNLRI